MMHSPLANCLVTVSCMCVRTWRFNHLSCIQFFIHFWNQTCFKGPSADSQTPCVSPFDLECKSPSQLSTDPPLCTGWCHTANNGGLTKLNGTSLRCAEEGRVGQVYTLSSHKFVHAVDSFCLHRY